jgi:hypothetical protein
MRIVPQSLFGRLTWVLLGGLIVAQLLSAAINYAERSQTLFRASGMQSAQRIAEVAKLLDSLGAAERPRTPAPAPTSSCSVRCCGARSATSVKSGCRCVGSPTPGRRSWSTGTAK